MGGEGCGTGEWQTGVGVGEKASQKRFCWSWALKVVRAPLAKGAGVRLQTICHAEAGRQERLLVWQ